MAISTLNEYYSSKGQALPSVSERQGMAAQAGIQNYTGTAQQNTQLLSSLMSNQGNQTAVPNTTIPAPVAVGTTTPVNLPNRPTPQEPSNLYTQAAAIIASLPKTGVAGIDQANQALAQLPGQLYEQQGIGAKQTAANEAQTALKLFEEETRQKLERERTNAQLGAETLASRSYAIEKDRAFMAGTLAIKAAAANQDFETAMSVMKTMSDMITEPLRQTRDFFKEMYMKTEDQKFQRAMRAEDRAYQAKRDELNNLNEFKIQLLKDGKIDPGSIGSIQSWDDFSKFTGIKKEDAIGELSARSTITNIEDAIANKSGLAGAVGSTIFGRREIFRQGKVQTFIGTVEQIAGQLTIDKLIQAKSSGATFGALSDSEQRLLAASASKLGSWAIKDKNGKTTGFEVPETEVVKELNKIKQFAVLDYERRTGRPYTTESDPAGLGIDTAQLDPAGILQ